ncbi:replication-relaxation family protein [Nocardia fusca]|uniref:replication-relaxation family protein n=1 Tax=Nocardia fusca TaxID=941183 RepID=UPI00378A754A
MPFEAGEVPELGGQVRTWGQLRQVLSDPGVPIATVDAVWARLISRSQVDGADAALICAGMAAPMLAGMASVFGPRRREDRADVEADLLAAFFAELSRIDLERPFLWFRLRWALFRGGRSWVRQEAAAPVPGADLGTDTGGHEPVPAMWTPEGHPEQVLAEAVAENVITAEVAELIAATRLEAQSMTALASRTAGLSHWALRKARQRGERDLVGWLAARAAATDPARTSTVERRALHQLSCAGDDRAAELAKQRQRLTGRDQELLHLLSTERELSAAQVADRLFPSIDTARKRLTALTRRGVLTRFRSHPGDGHRGVPPWHYALGPIGSALLAANRPDPLSATRPRPAHMTRPQQSMTPPGAAPAELPATVSRDHVATSGDSPDTSRSKSGTRTRSNRCGRTSAAPAYPATVEVNRRCA